MSYILDALNKSERERTVKKTPGLDSLSEKGDAGPSATKNLLIILAVLVTLNSAGIYWFFGRDIQKDQQVTEALPEATPVITTMNSPDTTELLEVAKPVDSVETSPVSRTDPEVDTLPSNNEVLPDNPPDLTITTHIFASDAEFRLVNINGIDRREGDLIGPAHRLVEITERGVMLEYQGERYNLNIIDDWQTP